MKYIKVIIPLGLILGIIFIYTDINGNNKELDTQRIDTKDNTKIEINNFITTDNKIKYSNTEHIKKILYSKVHLPREIKNIENDLVDMQNDIVKDLYLLDSEAKEIAKDDKEIINTIAIADKEIDRINKELNVSKEDIDKIEQSYTVMMNMPITTPESIAIENNLLTTDEKILDIEHDFDTLLGGN